MASLTLSTASLTFDAVDSTQHYMAATPITVTGTFQTSNPTGSGTIAMMSPADINGASGGLLKISYFSMTCSGTAEAGQTFVATLTPLVASSSVDCATFAKNFKSSSFGGMNFILDLFLDDRTLDDDTFPASNFTLVATAL